MFCRCFFGNFVINLRWFLHLPASVDVEHRCFLMQKFVKYNEIEHYMNIAIQ